MKFQQILNVSLCTSFLLFAQACSQGSGISMVGSPLSDGNVEGGGVPVVDPTAIPSGSLPGGSVAGSSGSSTNPSSGPSSGPSAGPSGSRVTDPPIVVDPAKGTHYCKQPEVEDDNESVGSSPSTRVKNHAAGGNGSQKILICHKGHNILIAMQGWLNGHKPHHAEDYIGKCGGAEDKDEEDAPHYKECDDNQTLPD